VITKTQNNVQIVVGHTAHDERLAEHKTNTGDQISPSNKSQDTQMYTKAEVISLLQKIAPEIVSGQKTIEDIINQYVENPISEPQPSPDIAPENPDYKTSQTGPDTCTNPEPEVRETPYKHPHHQKRQEPYQPLNCKTPNPHARHPRYPAFTRQYQHPSHQIWRPYESLNQYPHPRPLLSIRTQPFHPRNKQMNPSCYYRP
jgi:hypothetical protein